MQKLFMLVGWSNKFNTGAKVSFVTDMARISVSSCCTLRCLDDSLLQPEHIFLPVLQYIGLVTMPFACSMRHLVAKHFRFVMGGDNLGLVELLVEVLVLAGGSVLAHNKPSGGTLV